MGGRAIPCIIEQKFSFRRQGVVVFEYRLKAREPIKKARIYLGGVKVDSVNSKWVLEPGQRGKPPLVAPVLIRLRNRGFIILEPYQRVTFNHTSATVYSRQFRVFVVLDRISSAFPKGVDWRSGERLLTSRLRFNDRGWYANTVQPILILNEFPASSGWLRAMFLFGKGKKPNNLHQVERAFNSNPVVLPLEPAETAEPEPSALRRRLRRKMSCLSLPMNREKNCWNALQGLSEGSVGSSPALTRYINVFAKDEENYLLLVVVGEPGSSELLTSLIEPTGLSTPTR